MVHEWFKFGVPCGRQEMEEPEVVDESDNP